MKTDKVKVNKVAEALRRLAELQHSRDLIDAACAFLVQVVENQRRVVSPGGDRHPPLGTPEGDAS